jgi:hypothetical protein
MKRLCMNFLCLFAGLFTEFLGACLPQPPQATTSTRTDYILYKNYTYVYCEDKLRLIDYHYYYYNNNY